MLHVYTSLISYAGPDRLDVTRATGMQGEGGIFAPTWNLIKPVLDAGRIGGVPLEIWKNYIASYTALMERSQKAFPKRWNELLARERAVLCCYCHDTFFCHRRVLANLLVHRGAIDHGEVPPQWKPSP